MLAINAWDEPVETLTEFVKDQKLTHPILIDGGDVASTYGVSGVPANIWVDRKGVMVDAALGFDDPKHLEAKTKQLLESTP